nr:hypothetical protein [Tanacetum cinerariifolium]
MMGENEVQPVDENEDDKDHSNSDEGDMSDKEDDVLMGNNQRVKDSNGRNDEGDEGSRFSKETMGNLRA